MSNMWKDFYKRKNVKGKLLKAEVQQMKCGKCEKKIEDVYECETCGMDLCEECAQHASTPTCELVLCSGCMRSKK